MNSQPVLMSQQSLSWVLLKEMWNMSDLSLNWKILKLHLYNSSLISDADNI